MSTITIVITDLPKGRGCTVQTDGAPPAVGQSRTPAEALFTDLIRTCTKQSSGVQFANTAATLAGELVQAKASA